MASFISSLLLLIVATLTFVPTVLVLVAVSMATPAVSQSVDEPPDPSCNDWGESSRGAVSVLDGEVSWLSCPLFSHPSVYNYSSTQSAGHNLFWYRLLDGHDLEQPITYSSRLSKDRERLWLQPAATTDTGQYICMLRNRTSCSKISMRLKVLQPNETTRTGEGCEPPVAVAPIQAYIPLQSGKILDCPDVKDGEKMAENKMNESTMKVTWYHECRPYPFWSSDRELKGLSLQFHIMYNIYEGLYYCVVQYERRGTKLHFTRSINVTARQPINLPKIPSILHPTKEQVVSVKQNTDVRLRCRGLFPYLDSPWEIWWTVDGKTTEQLADPRFSQTNEFVKDDHGDRTEDRILLIKDFQSEDLKRKYNCSVKNAVGFETRQAQLEEEVSLPAMELGFGLGVTLLLMLLLFIIYHVFWLELLLLYRSWFGTDERHTDDKEYDVYISYARNSEEEQFVLSTLRRVLENELGYSVCIFDRDSLPGGNLSEAIVQSMQRSRRLLFILSPDFLAEKSFSLLECRLGLYVQHGHQSSIVAVTYRSVSKLPCVEVAQLRQAAAATVTWRGSRSEPRRSRFWLRLRLALPVRPLALGRRLIDSTSSHSDLAALALQRAQSIQSQRQRDRAGANQSRRNRRTSANQSRQTLHRGRGRGRRGAGSNGREEEPLHSCSECAKFVGQVEDRGAGLTVEMVSYDRTEIRSDPVLETAPTATPDPAHNAHSTPDPAHSTLDSTHSAHSTPGPAHNTHSTPDPAHNAHSTPGPAHNAQSTPDSAHNTHSTPDSAHNTHSTPDPAHNTHNTPDSAHNTHSTPDPAHNTHSTPDPAHNTHSTPDPAHNAHSTPYPAHNAHSTPDPAHSTPGPAHNTHSTTDPAHHTHSTPGPAHSTHSTPYPAHNAHSTPDPAHNTPGPAHNTHSTTDPAHHTHSTPGPAHTTHSTPDSAHNTHCTPDPAHNTHSTPGPAHTIHSTPDSAHNTHCTPDPAHNTHSTNDPAHNTHSTPGPAHNTHSTSDSAPLTHLAPDGGKHKQQQMIGSR